MRDCAWPCAPSHTSTSATDGHSRSIARASSIVRFGRRATSRKLLPEAKLSAPNFCTMIVFGPSCEIASRNDLSKPRISDVIPTIEVMPMTTPSTVSAERILLVRSVSNDITKISDSSPVRTPAIYSRLICYSAPLLAAQGLDRIELRRAHRRVEAEEQADQGRDADADRDRPRLHRRGQRRHLADPQREQEAEEGADEPAERRQRHGLRKDLPDDVAP